MPACSASWPGLLAGSFCCLVSCARVQPAAGAGPTPGLRALRRTWLSVRSSLAAIAAGLLLAAPLRTAAAGSHARHCSQRVLLRALMPQALPRTRKTLHS